MPNWCENTLEVSGPKQDIKKFKNVVKGKKTDLSLAKLYPEPDYTKIKVKPTFPGIVRKKGKFVDPKESWWDWRIQNWGTKWDITAKLVMNEEDALEYIFDSAWSPPVKWLEVVAKKFKNLSFILRYEERGCCFVGVATASKGQLRDQCLDYSA